MAEQNSQQPSSSQRDLQAGERLLGEGWTSDARIPHRLVREQQEEAGGQKTRRIISIPGLKP